MYLNAINSVDNFCITLMLSTALVFLHKLFILNRSISFPLQTVFVPVQVIDIKVENRLVHRNMACLSTTAIDL
jgi:hypothetical protein